MIDLERKHYVKLMAGLIAWSVWSASGSLDWGVTAFMLALFFDATTPG